MRIKSVKLGGFRLDITVNHRYFEFDIPLHPKESKQDDPGKIVVPLCSHA